MSRGVAKEKSATADEVEEEEDEGLMEYSLHEAKLRKEARRQRKAAEQKKNIVREQLAQVTQPGSIFRALF